MPSIVRLGGLSGAYAVVVVLVLVAPLSASPETAPTATVPDESAPAESAPPESAPAEPAPAEPAPAEPMDTETSPLETSPAARATTPATTPATTLSSLSASVTSPQSGTNIVCTENVFATVTLSNRGSATVNVTGIQVEARTVSGGCGALQPFTVGSGVATVRASQTETVLSNVEVFDGGSGCCIPGAVCDGTPFCEIYVTFFVLTNVGEVPAGGFSYGVTYNRCIPCAAGATAGTNCSDPVVRN
jgi:hypothetical protein